MIRYAIDRTSELRKHLRNRKIGLISNLAAVDSQYRSVPEILLRDYNVTALFGPEHGVWGNRQAGEAVTTVKSGAFGIPEFSLFGENSRLKPEHLHNVDLMVFDLPDAGGRFFTYFSTLTDAMEVCAQAQVPFLVLDRPNPLGGQIAEGTLLRNGFESFIGRFPIPARHALTAGEYARFVKETFRLQCRLEILPCSGLRREHTFDPAKRVWINPSPNLPSFDAALVFPGAGLFEGTNLSEGRGTTRPFECIGAPFLDPDAVLAEMPPLPGLVLRKCSFVPTFGKHQGTLCHGIHTVPTDRAAFRPVETALRILDAVRKTTPGFRFLDTRAIDRLFGDDVLRTGRESVDEIVTRGKREADHFFHHTAQPFLLYP